MNPIQKTMTHKSSTNNATRPQKKPASAMRKAAKATPAVNQLTTAEAKELGKQEAIIAKHQKAFMAAGEALVAIHQRRLYRQDYKTFADYCKTKWQISRQHAYRLMGAFLTVVRMSPAGDKSVPQTEGETRRLLHGLSGQEKLAVEKRCRDYGETLEEAVTFVKAARPARQEKPLPERLEPASLQQVLTWLEAVRIALQDAELEDTTIQRLNQAITVLKLGQLPAAPETVPTPGNVPDVTEKPANG